MKLVSYLFFKDNAAEAFDFYAHALGGKVTMKVTMGEMPGTETLPAQARSLIAHVRVEIGDAALMVPTGADRRRSHTPASTATRCR
jgi:PhnB protein